MAEGMSSVAIGCHCDDSEDPFLHNRWYSNTRRCEFEVDCVVSERHLSISKATLDCSVCACAVQDLYVHPR